MLQEDLRTAGANPNPTGEALISLREKAMNQPVFSDPQIDKIAAKLKEAYGITG